MDIKAPKEPKILITKPKSFFVLVIGDYGAILVFGKGNTLEMRNFFPNTDSKYLDDLKDIISADPQTPVYVLIDVLDQTYNPQSLPAVNALSIGGLVKKRLERDFPDNSLKGSLFIDRNQTGRKDWNYLFIATPYAPPLTEWLEAILALPNRLKHIGLVPVESEVFFNKVSKLVYPKVKSPFNIQMLVMHTKVGGIRQVVYKNGRIIFSRLISVENIEDDQIVAGQFEQEIQNTLQYLTRASKSTEKIEVFIICGTAIKTALSTNKEFHIYTPYEISVHMGFKNAVLPNDKFTDVMFGMMYCNARPVLPFSTSETRLLNNLYVTHKVSKALSALFCFTIFAIYALYFITTESISNQIDADQEKLGYIAREIDSRKKETKIDESESRKIIEVTSIYKTLTEDKLNPKAILSRVQKAIRKDATIRSFEWKSNNISTVPQASTPNPLGMTALEISISVSFINTGNSYQELFNNFDNFVKNIENEFKEYQVEYTRINQQITFQESKQQIPINITLRGPKS
ncbi:MAG: hypothetical protein BGO27_08180 [Alphaproteobacteria bacterium 33-17]|nr:MAG: hypothetical protein BGO27_08180 [Alphaproteobacteria bacterium 33-17]